MYTTVHRDLKPRNVLLSHSTRGVTRAIISDFGLCRKLPDNRQSYTAMSGIAGTEGWIAPEVFIQDGKVVGSLLRCFSAIHIQAYPMLMLSFILRVSRFSMYR